MKPSDWAASTPDPVTVHDAFDWWTGIWLPLIFGGFTVAVSIASIWFAIAALRAAKASNELAERVAADARRDKRAQLAHLVGQAVSVETANWWAGTHDQNSSWDGLSAAVADAQLAGAEVPEFVVRQAMRWHEVIDYKKLKRPATWIIGKDFSQNTLPLLDKYVEVEDFHPTLTERTLADISDLASLKPWDFDDPEPTAGA